MGAGSKRTDDEIISDINITPFVDVSLVLLIIFMVTATYIVAKSIPVDLPEAGTGEDIVTTFAVTMTKDGNMYLDGVTIDEGQLRKQLALARKQNEDVRVIIDADKELTHGKVVHVIDLVRKQGVSKFAININEESEQD